MLGLMVLIGGLVTLPPVQTWLVRQSTHILEREIGVPVNLRAVDVAFPAYAVLEDLALCDPHDQSLLRLQELRLGIFSFSLWRYLLAHQQAHTLTLSHLTLIRPELNLYRDPQGQLNLDFLTAALRSDGPIRPQRRSLPFNLELKALRIQDGRFAYVDSTHPRLGSLRRGRINHHHLLVEDLDLRLNFRMDTALRTWLELEDLSLYERYADWRLDELSFRLVGDTLQADGQPLTQVRDLRLYADGTQLHTQIDWPDQWLSDILAFDHRFRYTVDFAEDNQVDLRTIEALAGEEIPLYGQPYLAGQVQGTLDHLLAPDLRLRLGAKTELHCRVQLDTLQRARRSRLSVDLFEAQVLPLDLQRLLVGIELPRDWEQWSPVPVTGRFEGSYHAFRVDFLSQTEQGGLGGELDIELPPLVAQPRYQGKVKTQHLNLDAFGLSPQRLSRDLTLEVEVIPQGRGLQLDGRVLRSDLMGYALDSLALQAFWEPDHYRGRLFASDGQGTLELESAEADLRAAQAHFRGRGRVQGLDLARYGVGDSSVRLSHRFDLALTGNSLEEMGGSLGLVDLHFQKPGDAASLRVDSLRLIARQNREAAENQAPERRFCLRSDLLQAEVEGAFTLARLGRLVEQIETETRLFWANTDSLTQAYYQAKAIDTTDLRLRLTVSPRDTLNGFFRFLGLPAYVGWKAAERGEAFFTFDLDYQYRGDSSSFEDVNVYLAEADSLMLGGVSLVQLGGDLNLAKLVHQNAFLLGGDLHSKRLYPSPGLVFSGIDWVVQGNSRSVSSHLIAYQPSSQVALDLGVGVGFEQDGALSAKIYPEESSLAIEADTLRFIEADTIRIWRDSIRVEQLRLANRSRSRSFQAQGVISPHDRDSLVVRLDSFQLHTLDELLNMGYRLDGVYNARAVLQAVLGELKVGLQSRLFGLAIDRHPYGDLSLFSRYLPETRAMAVRAEVFEGRDTTLLIRGQYRFEAQDSPLAFELLTLPGRGFPLNYITPFVEGELYNIEGEVALSEFTVRGTVNNPRVQGEGFFYGADFGVSYFQTNYQLLGQVVFRDDRIVLQELQLQDRRRSPYHRASLHGSTVFLNQVYFDVLVDSVQNFLLMDTRKGDNELFYGTLYLRDALAQMTGDLSHLSINAVASFAPNSSLRLPLTDQSSYGRPDYIIFESEQGQAEEKTTTDLLGYDINLTALLNENLQVELIFDERVGDIIRGRGEGSLTLRVDEAGTFSMFGRYEVTGGDYLFTSQNIINKKFEVVPGGTITWTGDPYDAQLDLYARYPVMADIRDLVGSERPIRVPTNVLMHMQGSLERPEISLSIEINNLNESYANQVVSYVRQIQSGEQAQELNKQVFSLMAFGRFSPPGFSNQSASTGALAAGVTTSISELLSNQFNYWLSQVTGNKLNVNVSAADLQDINLLISAKLFNDRVTIERDGSIPGTNFDSGIDGQREASANQLSDLIGNISLIIRLLPNENTTDEVNPSELVLEVFNRNALTQTTLGNNMASTQTGLGLFYKKDFDRLQDLLRRRSQAKSDSLRP